MNAPLPQWLERILGLSPQGTGEGTVGTLNHAWNWAPWFSVVFAALAIVGVWWLYTREGGDASHRTRSLLGLMRLSALAIVLFMIAEVVISLERTGLPFVAILVDDSASMGLVDRYDDEKTRQSLAERASALELGEPTRLNLAKAVLLEDRAAFLRNIDRRFKLKLYFLSESARPQSGTLGEIETLVAGVQPLGQTSRLGQGVRGVLNDLRGTPPAALVILSDGITTEGEKLSDTAGYALRKGVPLFAIGIGDEAAARDLRLTDLLVEDVVFVDDVVNFECKLTATGLAGRAVEVVLHRADDETPLAKTTATLGPDDQPQTVRIGYRPTEVGEFDFVVEVHPLTDELQSDNNRQQAQVSVRKEKIRVLLVQSAPSYEFRYLKNLLERDQTIELKTVLQEADPEYVESDRTALRVFPNRREALYEFDVVVLGDVNPQFLSAASLSHLVEFVEDKGGGMVLIAGPRYTPWAFANSPLASVFPLDLAAAGTPEARAFREPFAMRPTELGLATPSLELGDTPDETRKIWSALPGLYWFVPTPRLKPGAAVLAEHSEELSAEGKPWPLVTLQFAGAGRVLYHATDETWRWRYLVGDAYFARYWVQTIRYLSHNKLVGKDRAAELASDRREYRRGETVRLRVRFTDDAQVPSADDGVAVVAENPSGRNQRITLYRTAMQRNVFEGDFSPAHLGAYHCWLASPPPSDKPAASDFRVVAPPGELARTQLDVAELTQSAEQTQGRFYRIADARRLLNDLPSGRQVPIETLPPWVLWNKWPLVLALVILLVAEWSVRKWCGML